MHYTVLYMANTKELKEKLDELISGGNEITCITHLRELREPNMDGVVVTDWLIVYRKVGKFK